jgi:hypothetical protein
MFDVGRSMFDVHFLSLLDKNNLALLGITPARKGSIQLRGFGGGIPQVKGLKV